MKGIMKVELVLRDGSAIDVPSEILKVDSRGFARFAPVDVAAGATVVAARVTYDLEPEPFRAAGTFSLAIRGIDLQ